MTFSTDFYFVVTQMLHVSNNWTSILKTSFCFLLSRISKIWCCVPISDFLPNTDSCFQTVKVFIVSEYKVKQEIKSDWDQQAVLPTPCNAPCVIQVLVEKLFPDTFWCSCKHKPQTPCCRMQMLRVMGSTYWITVLEHHLFFTVHFWTC